MEDKPLTSSGTNPDHEKDTNNSELIQSSRTEEKTAHDQNYGSSYEQSYSYVNEQPAEKTFINESTSEFNNNYDKKNRKRSIVKGLLTNLFVGVVSSLLTIGLLTHFDLAITMNEGQVNAADHMANEAVNQSNQASYTRTFKDPEGVTMADVVEEVSPAIVGVVNIQQMRNSFYPQSQNVEAGSGSGVIYKKEGKYAYIVTNNHVIEDASEVEISFYNGEKTSAEIVGADVLSDLAVLRIDGKYAEKVAKFGDSSHLRPGDEVIAIGNPLGLEFSRTVTQGIISATERNVPVQTSAGEWELTVIQTDAAINPGNSGGALINSQGEVIGINSLKISQTGVEGLGFAIPSNDVIPIAEQLIDKGQIKRPYLGIQMYNVEDLASFYRQNLAGSLNEGIIVAAVEPSSPADQAGLEVNDIIVGIGGEKVSSTSDFKKYLYRNVKPGESVKIEYYRNGVKNTAQIKTAAN